MARRSSTRRKDKRSRIAEWEKKDASFFSRLGFSREVLTRLEQELVGKIVFPGDPDYDKDRQESNPAFQEYPMIIVYCAVEADVLWCLWAAQRTGVWVCVRSGGHSTAGYSVNSGMVIDVSLMSYVQVNAIGRTVTVGAGTDFDTLNGALNPTGLHVPSGECGNVHVAGFVQGGGYGYTSRCFGIQSDCVLSFRVVLANGGVAIASQNSNSDLYWALRGGTGGNFGVVTEITYQLFPVASVWAYALQWDIGHAAAALLEMQTNYMLTGAPKELGATINLGVNGSTPVLLMQGMYVGSASDGKLALSSLLKLGNPTLWENTGPYGAMDTWLDTNPYVIPNPPDGSKEDKRAGYVGKPLALSDWQAVVAYAQTAPNPNNTAIIEPYGGAINAFPKYGSAFIHREASMDFFVDVFWVQDSDRAREVAWMEGFMALMKPFLNGHVYQNYPHRGFADFRQAYWGDAYARLTLVKAKYDPSNFFHFEQSIAVGTIDSAATSDPITYELAPFQPWS